MPIPRARTRAAAAALLLAVVLTLVPAPAEAWRADGPITDMITDTTLDIPPGAVVLARADSFVDALAGGPFAVAQNAPMLLTSTDSLHLATQAEIRRVLPAGRVAFILGGTAAVSDAVKAQVQALGYPAERIAGDTRYAISVAIAERTTTDDG